METIIALGLISFVGLAFYFVQRRPSDEPKAKRKRGDHPTMMMGYDDDPARHHPQRRTNNLIALYYGIRGHRKLLKQESDAAIPLFDRAIRFAPKCTTGSRSTG